MAVMGAGSRQVGSTDERNGKTGTRAGQPTKVIPHLRGWVSPTNCIHTHYLSKKSLHQMCSALV